MKSDQLLQIFKSSLSLSLILSKQSCSLLRILTFQRVVTNLAVKELYKMIPYVVTIIVLIITSVRSKRENQPPASLGLPYFREER